MLDVGLLGGRGRVVFGTHMPHRLEVLLGKSLCVWRGNQARPDPNVEPGADVEYPILPVEAEIALCRCKFLAPWKANVLHMGMMSVDDAERHLVDAIKGVEARPPFAKSVVLGVVTVQVLLLLQVLRLPSVGKTQAFLESSPVAALPILYPDAVLASDHAASQVGLDGVDIIRDALFPLQLPQRDLLLLLALAIMHELQPCMEYVVLAKDLGDEPDLHKSHNPLDRVCIVRHHAR
mmetsp:Transcript_125447/g.267837  ORF Transcript_125447/g.267837 Transcript_125447/m.267837 type:complete len:235 (+) Transcript_125447:1771-2475(+)